VNIVWLSWKDMRHPEAGGAELVTHQNLARLVKDGHNVTLLTSQPAGLPHEETTAEGYKIIRQGSRYTVYPKVRAYYKKHLLDSTDLTIEEINTIPFFSQTYTKKPPVLFFHQLAREVWFYQMTWPLSWIGYAIEPLYLRVLNKRKVITISDSTKQDLIKTAGFKPQNISLVRVGIELTPLASLAKVKKYDQPTLLSLGSVRPMKGTLNIVKAYEVAKKTLPNLRLIIAGNNSGPYGQKVLSYIGRSPYKADIEVLGGVSTEKKQELMRLCHAIAQASIKEGWGLTVTEANSQGTPAVSYDVDGLRNSVKNGSTGFVTATNPAALGQGIVSLLSDEQTYQTIRHQAWEDSKQYTFDTTYADLKKALGL